MKNVLTLALLFGCGISHSQDAPAVKSIFNAEIYLRSCRQLDQNRKFLNCYAEAYTDAHKFIDLQKSIVDMVTDSIRPNLVEAAKALAKIKADIAGAQLVNRAFVPLLREELQSSPAALALLPKLHAAVDVAIVGKEAEPSESKMVYRQRLARNHAAVVTLLKEVEFSQ